MSKPLETALFYAEQILEFPIGNCNPSDDPDKQTAFLYAFRQLAKLYVASARRIGDGELIGMLSTIDTSPDFITDAYDLHAELSCTIDFLNEKSKDPQYGMKHFADACFVDLKLLDEIRGIQSPEFDAKKIVRFCEELNDAYKHGNYISCALLIRAVMNHVPPIFGVETYPQVVAGAGRSVKAILASLQDQARPIADLHTHLLIRKKEPLPTKHQIEPHKSGFEILLHEILVKISTPTPTI